MHRIRTHLDDILIGLGECLIIAATAMISPIAAMYVAGVCLIVDGVLVGMGQRGGEG
jgi:hypothetical protein